MFGNITNLYGQYFMTSNLRMKYIFDKKMISYFRPKYFAGIYLVAAGGPPIPPKKEGTKIN